LSGRMRGSPRVTAFWGNSGGSCVMRKKRKVVMAIVPARKRELGLSCPYVVSAVAEVGRQHPGLE
jgi:hypothetical protein